MESSGEGREEYPENIQAHVGGRMFGKRKETDLEAFVQMEDSRMHFLSSIK